MVNKFSECLNSSHVVETSAQEKNRHRNWNYRKIAHTNKSKMAIKKTVIKECGMLCAKLNACQRLVNVSSNCEKSNQRSPRLTVKCECLLDCPTFHSDDDAVVKHGRLTKGLQNCFCTSWQRWKTTKFHPRVHSLWEMHLMTMREGSTI